MHDSSQTCLTHHLSFIIFYNAFQIQKVISFALKFQKLWNWKLFLCSRISLLLRVTTSFRINFYDESSIPLSKLVVVACHKIINFALNHSGIKTSFYVKNFDRFFIFIEKELPRATNTSVSIWHDGGVDVECCEEILLLLEKWKRFFWIIKLRSFARTLIKKFFFGKSGGGVKKILPRNLCSFNAVELGWRRLFSLRQLKSGKILFSFVPNNIV